MRPFLTASAVACLMASPSIAYVNVRIVPSLLLVGPGQTATLEFQVQVVSSPPRGIGIVAGNLSSTNAGGHITGLTWIPQMQNPVSPAQNGATDGHWGWQGFAATQSVPNDPNLGLNVFSTVATITVRNEMVSSVSYITFVNAPVLNPVTQSYRRTSSLNLGGIPATFDTTIGTVTGALFGEIPEPTTLALLALGGRFLVHRRRVRLTRKDQGTQAEGNQTTPGAP